MSTHDAGVHTDDPLDGLAVDHLTVISPAASAVARFRRRLDDRSSLVREFTRPTPDISTTLN
jgi:hypothetical protein